MCVHLFAGTEHEIPRKACDRENPDLCVEPLTDEEAAIRNHFSKANAQYVGSTSGCGCAFPHAVLEQWGWLAFEYDEDDPEFCGKERYNRQALVALLRSTGDAVVELYGVWTGDFAEASKARESIPIGDILAPSFFFKEQWFYTVKISDANNALHTDRDSAALHPHR